MTPDAVTPDAARNGAADPAAIPPADASAPPAVDATAPPDAGSSIDTAPAAAAAAAQDSGAQDPATPDPAALTARLTAVVKQLMPIIAADPTQRDAVRAIVAQAQAGLKSGDLETASVHVDTLHALLDGTGAPAGTDPAAAPAATASATAAPPPAATASAPLAGNGAAATYAKSRMVWLAARKKVDGDIGKLHDEFMAVFKDHSKADDLGTAFRSRVGSVMDRLDENLAHKLDEIATNTDPGQHAKLVQEAQGLLQGYEAYLANEPLIATLDSNPFTPLAIQKTMTATLTALGKALS
jgi:hypothetical protein